MSVFINEKFQIISIYCICYKQNVDYCLISIHETVEWCVAFIYLNL